MNNERFRYRRDLLISIALDAELLRIYLLYEIGTTIVQLLLWFCIYGKMADVGHKTEGWLIG
jgi:hypothetical protein